MNVVKKKFINFKSKILVWFSYQLKKEIVEEHNKVRENPKSYIPVCEKYIKYFKGNILNKPGLDYGIETNEGKDAYSECIEFLKKQKPVQALKHDDGLSKASQDHADDIGANGSCDHTGSDGSQADERVDRYVQWDVTICENIDFGATTGEEILISLLVDDGVTDRGHRKNIFNDKLSYIGVGAGPHTEYGVCSVMDYVGNIKNKIKGNIAEDKVKALAGVFNAKGKKEDLSEELDRKLNVKKVVVDDPFKDDPDAPEGAVSCSVKTTTRTAAGKTTKKTVKTYTLEDGSKEVVELSEIV